MSESDSDCVITDFRGVESYDDCVVSPRNERTRIQYVIPMTGDKHCIAHCFSSHFSSHFKEPIDKVLDRLDNEFRKNLAIFGCFSELNKGRNS